MVQTPRIAIPRWRQPVAERMLYYAQSVRAAGGRPVFIDPGQPLDGFDGLLLMGGADIDPARYGETPASLTRHSNPRRDAHELTALQAALAGDLPVLGICRGHQLLNVALGGKLLQHTEGHHVDRDDNSAWHDVELGSQSRLARIYDDARSLGVNSRHHQAVTADRLSPQLIATARAGDVTEAVEDHDHRWVVGVQWHPERPEMRPAGEPLFRAFVAACRK